jgi:hydrogenase/urease accessory protein HupE
MCVLSRLLPFHLFVTALFLVSAIPVSAHDMGVAGSRWCFAKDRLTASIDITPAMLAEIRRIREGSSSLDDGPEKQLHRIAADIVQPYLNERLSFTVTDRRYPVTVTRLVRNENGRYVIWLLADGLAFTNETSQVRIDYGLLFEDMKSTHMNLGYVYFSDATGDALQRVFDFSPPAFNHTFERDSHVWEFPVKGTLVAVAPPATPRVTATVAAGMKTIDRTKDSKPAAESMKTAGAPASVGTAGVVAVSSGKTTTPVSPVSANGVTAGSKEKIMPNSAASAPSGETANAASSPGTSLWSGIGTFFLLGIEHILTGYDHIAFLLALIVVGLASREVLKIVTAFTAAHSITLLLAALQIITLNSRFVEAMIAISICYVALENILKKKTDYRWLITFGFGLIHGFGFASALQELIAGKSNLVASVLAFNLGVETGQLMIFFILLPILYYLKKSARFRLVTAGTSAAVFAMGFAWLVERAFDLKLMPF